MFKRIQDSRAFMGGLALLVIGFILSFMQAFFVSPTVFEHNLLVARWWWEIVLNLQIMCLALMWFCHHERILHAQGWWRIRAISNMIVGLLSVSYPIVVFIVAAYCDWFRAPPGYHETLFLLMCGLGLWAIGAFVLPSIYWFKAVGRQGRGGRLQGVSNLGNWGKLLWPTLLVMALLGLGIGMGWKPLYVLVPFLVYMQGALPYMRKAVHFSERDSLF